jgi:alkylresorcinol/alkylpyrone synthase
VATALFGDGAAAVLLDGVEGIPEIIDTRSTLWPDSLDVMGWNILNSGMQVVLIKALPGFISSKIRKDMEDFIFRHELKLEDISHFLIHPGGAKVLDAYRKALCLSPEALALSEGVLREHGNISSVTILYILERFLRSEKRESSSWGLLNAVGPGFSSQNLLIRA